MKGDMSLAALEVLLDYIRDGMEKTREVLNTKSVITDGDTDTTQFLRGRMDAYVNIKFFVEREMRDV